MIWKQVLTSYQHAVMEAVAFPWRINLPALCAVLSSQHAAGTFQGPAGRKFSDELDRDPPSRLLISPLLVGYRNVSLCSTMFPAGPCATAAAAA